MATTEFEDAELHASLEAVLERLIDELFIHLSEEVIPQRELVQKTENGFESVYEPDFHKLMTSYTENWTDYAEYSHCVDAFMGSHVYTDDSVFMPVSDAESRSHIGRVVVPQLFTQYFNRKGSVEFDKDVFKEIYLEFEEHLRSDSVWFRSWALISNFEMDQEVLDLDDHLKIRRVTPHERADAKSYIMRGGLSRFDLMDDFLVEAEFEIPKNPEGTISLDEGQELFDAVMLALRLFDEGGDVRYKSVFTEQFPVNYSGMGTQSSMGENRGGILSERCELGVDDMERFIEFWSSYQSYFKLNESTSISNPLRRFDQMDQKSIVEDAVIDSVIAFESTLLEEIGQTESYRFRMPLRASLLLEDRSEHDRDFIYQFFRELYDARSAIVHRGREISNTEIEGHNMNPTEFTGQSREFLRHTLLEYIQRLEQGQSMQQVNQEIDQALLEADYPVSDD